jgi:hypothetical protein
MMMTQFATYKKMEKDLTKKQIYRTIKAQNYCSL